MKLKHSQKIKILREHSITIKPRINDGLRIEVFAEATKDGVDCSEWIDVTNFNRAELFAWLGY